MNNDTYKSIIILTMTVFICCAILTGMVGFRMKTIERKQVVLETKVETFLEAMRFMAQGNYVPVATNTVSAE